MINDIAFLEQIFGQMQQAGFVDTKSDFSQRLLGKGASYLTSMAARDRHIPMDVLDHMSIHLLERATITSAAIAEMETALSQLMAQAHREAEIRNQFESHRRQRLGDEFTDVDQGAQDNAPALATSRFIRAVLQKAGLMKVVHFQPGDMTSARTLQ